MDDLRVMFVLFYKNEMIERNIIPKGVKWDMLTEEQKENVKKFIINKLEKQKSVKEADNKC